MKQLLLVRTSIFGAALLAALLTCCKKEETTGTITGSIAPSDAVSSVVATDGKGHRYAATPESNGNFKLTNVEPGTYQVRCTTRSSYYLPYGGVTPAARPATVGAGQTASLGTIQVWPGSGAEGGTGTCLLNGNAYTPIRVQGSGGNAGTELSVVFVRDPLDRLSLHLSQCTGRGTYALNAVSTGVLSLGGSSCGPMELSTRNGGSGTVTITAYDTGTRLCAGTFSFTAYPALTNCGVTSAVVTAGTFAEVPF